MNKPDTKTLKQMSDEVKLKIHLAGMELKTEWEKLEPQVEKVLNDVAIASGEAVADLQLRLEDLKRKLKA